jgi:hypothetical protein
MADLLSGFEFSTAGAATSTQDAEWDTWVTDSVGMGMEIDSVAVSPPPPLFGNGAADGGIDELLSAMGWSVDWLPDAHD